MNEDDHRFVGDRPASPAVRAAVLAAALALTWLCFRVIGPAFHALLQPVLAGADPGPATFLSHLLLYTTVSATLCFAALALLARLGLMKLPPLAGRGLPVAVREGAVFGLGISAATALLWLAIGPGFQASFGGWKLLGDVFSNFYEEVVYRAFVFGIGLLAFRRWWAAALLSGLAFAWTHDQFPLAFRAFVLIVGFAFSACYRRGGGLLAAWLAHTITDALLDTFLKN